MVIPRIPTLVFHKKRDLCTMSTRVLLHVGFWLFFVTLDALVSISFPGTSDLVYPPVQRFLRFLLNHLAFLPWQIIPFYALFYWLIPTYLTKRKYLHFGIYTILILLSCILVYRSLIKPMSWLLYQDMPDFNTFSARRLFYTFMEFLPALGVASTIKLIRGRMAAQQREQQLRNEKLASELNFLKAQTNPHFLFNTLNNLYGLARRKDNNTAPSIMKLSNIMRYILYECNAPFIPIYKEIKIIQDYIELEQLRYDERLEVNPVRIWRIKWSKTPSIGPNTTRIACLIQFGGKKEGDCSDVNEVCH